MSENTMIHKQEVIKTAYAAFNARDIDSILPLMDPDVKWARAFEGDYARGHDEVRAYWQRQWKEIDPHVVPVGFYERPDGSLEVEVDQLVKDLQGAVIFEGKVRHIHVISDGLMKQMDVEA